MKFIGAGTGMRLWSEREENSDRNGRGAGAGYRHGRALETPSVEGFYTGEP